MASCLSNNSPNNCISIDSFRHRKAGTDHKRRVSPCFTTFKSVAFTNSIYPLTAIPFALPEKSNVKIAVYDILGREVCQLLNRDLQAGYHNIVWNGISSQGMQVASGIYFVSMKTDQYLKTRKIIMLK